MIEKPGNYNLLVEQWIPVLRTNGNSDRVGIRTALIGAGRIRQIAASNPMDSVALVRLLLAVLQWCKPTLSDADHESLKSARGIPSDWLQKTLDSEGRPKSGFCLLGTHARFYQDQRVSGERPERFVSDLFAYFPAATEINHFRHVHDQTVALCPACCALGLLRLSACAMQGGQGKSPSINNAPPIYILPIGPTLMETLRLNWPLQATTAHDGPAWEPGKRPAGRIGVLEGLTWQPRALWLGPLVGGFGKTCARCGAPGPLISRLVCKKGRSLKTDGRAWRDDPHVPWAATGARSGEDRALRGPDPLKYSLRESALWCGTIRAVLESAGNDPPVPSVASALARLQEPADLRVACFEPFTRQAKTFDEHRDGWCIPLNVLRNEHLRDLAVAQIHWLERLDVSKCLPARSRSLPGSAPVAGTPDAARNSARSLIAGDAQDRLCERFRTFLKDLARADTDEKADHCARSWQDDVNAILQKALDCALSLTTACSSFRRQEAAEVARRNLHWAIRRLSGSAEEASVPRPSARAKGEPRKRGRK